MIQINEEILKEFDDDALYDFLREVDELSDEILEEE